ncbi:YceH family protein [Pelagicoccus sp. SDUM812002]|uniref:YceH family protein n=1 Tax=Pelagicoccus sp. SDUM812002 TaxID=3041266 RepID=UPI00280C7582|nr:YceH family protein [Pelagicoccus sp. SDUM812002]MDQ8187348.1 YceH family protein [Pelagicoccus sp. SDUM812002]
MSDENPLPHEPLSLIETRILGCLIEKEATTPDLYPLTLNSLINACNQKSNRSPALELEEETVSAGLESLRHKKLALLVTQTAARVAKYKHSLDNHYPLPSPQVTILAELLLRGPQTAGELRTRCERMYHFDGLDTMRDELQQLATRPTPLVMELPRQPGKKDARFVHLLAGPPNLEELATPSATSSGPVKVDLAITLPAEAEARIAALEATVSEQAGAIASLREELSAFRSQFE